MVLSYLWVASNWTNHLSWWQNLYPLNHLARPLSSLEILPVWFCCSHFQWIWRICFYFFNNLFATKSQIKALVEVKVVSKTNIFLSPNCLSQIFWCGPNAYLFLQLNIFHGNRIHKMLKGKSAWLVLFLFTYYLCSSSISDMLLL